MIARLRGTFDGASGDAAVVDVSGVGYAVFVPTSVRMSQGDDVVLHISTQVREDAITLYGFLSTDEREVFDVLHSVSGVGPRTALAVLSHLPLHELRAAIGQEDLRVITKVPGIGKKTAQRLCLELKDKLPVRFEPTGSQSPQPRATPDPLPLALAQLEYKKSEIDFAVGADSVPAFETAPLEDRLRAALRVLAGR